MFREMIRKAKQLPECEVIDILRNQKRGVLSIQGDDGYPYGMPMNHFYNEEDGCIYFHQGNVGYRLEKLREDDHVSEGVGAADSLSIISFQFHMY